MIFFLRKVKILHWIYLIKLFLEKPWSSLDIKIKTQ